jgi:hypothetical protein
MKKNLFGLMGVVVVAIMSAQSAMAATLHCTIAKSPDLTPREWNLPISPVAGAKERVLLGTFNGMQVFADVLSYGDQFSNLPASSSIFVIANGTRIDGGDRLLLSTSSKQVLDARCSILK